MRSRAWRYAPRPPLAWSGPKARPAIIFGFSWTKLQATTAPGRPGPVMSGDAFHIGCYDGLSCQLFVSAMRSSAVLLRMMSDHCRVHVAPVLPPRDTAKFLDYLRGLVSSRQAPPIFDFSYDWSRVASASAISVEQLIAVRRHLEPALDMVRRQFPRVTVSKPRPKADPAAAKLPATVGSDGERGALQRKRGVKPKPIELQPTPLHDDDHSPTTFPEALVAQMDRHGDTPYHLHRALSAQGGKIDQSTLRFWISGRAVPRTVSSMTVLRLIEARYRLASGYFNATLPHRVRAPRGHRVHGIAQSEMRRLAWHLPDDFAERPASEREAILTWVRSNITSGTTEYRRFQAAASKQRYAIRFPGLPGGRRRPAPDDAEPSADRYIGPDAPPHLLEEMSRLIRFKSATLSAPGYKRSGVWGKETVAQKIEHLALMFGALAAPTDGPVRGGGIPVGQLTIGLLVFPAIWDWYINWREDRRGFFTAWELDMLAQATAFTRAETGWIYQTPELAGRLAPVPGLLGQDDIDAAIADWPGVCARMHKHASARSKEVQRVVKVHRDPFEPILAVLEAASPVGEYRKIAEEILRHIPDERRHPLAAAEAVRSFLLVRLGLHLGIRQKNLRQLRVCARGRQPMNERQMADLACGELRWSERDAGWEVVIPAVAFKNAGSSYFSGKPYRLVLPDLGQLYAFIEAYIDRHRARLLRGAEDPGTFFVKTAKAKTVSAAYGQTSIYEAWRLITQRYAIFNPYTGRGAIKGLLPHGPHSVRDVVATHILKLTGSYEQASYAIQDTPEMVAKHYGRFLPQDKAALAAQVLNKVWEAA